MTNQSNDTFDTSLNDSQATMVTPLSPASFDIGAYADYELELLEKCSRFWEQDSGVLVYRRFRVAQVFSSGCRYMEESLEWQLGAFIK